MSPLAMAGRRDGWPGASVRLWFQLTVMDQLNDFCLTDQIWADRE